MDMALRPRDRPASISSRYGSLLLTADAGVAGVAPEPVATSPSWAALAGSGPVVTSLAGFAFRRPPPGARMTIPAAFRYPAAVSRRTPVAASIRRSAQPSWPSAMTCFFFSSFKTLLTLTEGNSSRQSQCPDYFLIGRFWVTAEEPGLDRVRAKGKSGFKCGWACKVLCLITNTGTLRRHSLRASRPWIFKSCLLYTSRCV